MKKYKYDIGDVVQLKDQIHFDYPFKYAGKIAIIVKHSTSYGASGYWAIISGEGNKKEFISYDEIYKAI